VRSVACVLIITLVSVTPTVATAQVQKDSRGFLARPLLVASAAILVTGLADNAIRGAMRRSGPETHEAGVAVSQTSPRLAIGFGVAALGVGLATHSPALARTGRDGLIAMGVAGVLTVAAKAVIGRERPNGADNTDSDSFEPFTFETEDNSFPSGHTSQAFALAAVVAGHTHNRLVRITAYAGASAVGIARIAADRHFASDVVAGAILDTLVGHRVVRHFAPAEPRLTIMPLVTPTQVTLSLQRTF
jgi:membrane-associated phospholipid phosphatase